MSLVTLGPTEVEIEGESLPSQRIGEVHSEERIRGTDVMTVICGDLAVTIVVFELDVTRDSIRLNLVGIDLGLVLEYSKFLYVVKSKP